MGRRTCAWLLVHDVMIPARRHDPCPCPPCTAAHQACSSSGTAPTPLASSTPGSSGWTRTKRWGAAAAPTRGCSPEAACPGCTAPACARRHIPPARPQPAHSLQPAPFLHRSHHHPPNHGQAWDQNVFNFVAMDGMTPLQSPPDQPRLVSRRAGAGDALAAGAVHAARCRAPLLLTESPTRVAWRHPCCCRLKPRRARPSDPEELCTSRS